MSIHSTRRPIRASEAATPPVMEVFPVPPLPDVIALTVPMRDSS